MSTHCWVTQTASKHLATEYTLRNNRGSGVFSMPCRAEPHHTVSTQHAAMSHGTRSRGISCDLRVSASDVTLTTHLARVDTNFADKRRSGRLQILLLLLLRTSLTPPHGPHGKRRLLLLRMRIYSFIAWHCPRFLGADHTENRFPYIVTFLKRVFTGRLIETAVILLLPVFVVKMFTDIPLLLRNLATGSTPWICLRVNLFTNPFPSKGCTFNNI
jgi:hypothetical protein